MHLTQAEAAAKVGLLSKTISALENNPERCTLDSFLKFLKAQILFWLLAAPDGHAKDFSIFLERQGRYTLTPLYDVVSAYPALGHGVGMKGINTPGQALERGGVASFSAPRGSRISPCFPGTRSVMEQ
ncbi:MAG: HipA domain-containing protein [Sphaerochaeta sp.]|nr:HipA domain-containing protein [Sphaerochaeta sp.]